MYTHFKKCPGTHKLGPLYVVDSVARKYLDLAKKSQQPVSADAPDGTYGAGVYRITELLPTLMNDILQHAPPEENKVRYFPENEHKFNGDSWAEYSSGYQSVVKLYILSISTLATIEKPPPSCYRFEPYIYSFASKCRGIQLTQILCLLGQNRKARSDLGAQLNISPRGFGRH